MPELLPPRSQSERAWSRLTIIEQHCARIAAAQSELRLELVRLSREDTAPADRVYLRDELAVALAESPNTTYRWLMEAQMYSEHPAVIARVGLPLSEGGWSIRHADALLAAIAGLGLTPAVQQQVVDLVADHPDARTPYQIRKAAQAAVMILDPEGAERRLARARKERRVQGDAHSDGSGFFFAAGTASQIAMVMASIDATAGPKQPGDDRSLDQRRFDTFMDLICGRVQPGQWQAVVVVALETLNGTSEQPAELPGFGLISAAEARDLLPFAELRRAVVNEHGELVSLDSTVHRPDLPAPVALDEPHPDTGLSLDTEPTPHDPTPEHEPDEADALWLLGIEADDALVTALTSALEEQLEQLLRTHRAPALAGVHVAEPRALIELEGYRHGPPPHDEPPGDGGGGPWDPPEQDPPEPDPPSLDDRDWAERTVDRDAQDALEPPPTYEPEPSTPPGPDRRFTLWSMRALTAAHDRLRRAPLDARPLTSTAYALPPRLARFVKLRDICCSFPGCPRLARDAQNDHLIPWPRGATAAANVDSKCGHHHQAKTHGRFQSIRLADGTIRWTTPLGRTLDRRPRPLLRGF